MTVWMKETRPELIGEMVSKADELYVPGGNSKCILCRSDMDTCAYCFTEHMLNWLRKYPELIPEFVMFFNYDLQYHGYSEKLLQLV